MAVDDGSLDDETKAAESDPAVVRRWTVTALWLGVVGAVCSLPILGWHAEYPLSVVAALVVSGFVLALWLRRAREDDVDLTRSLALSAAMSIGAGLVMQMAVLMTLLDTTVFWLDAYLLISGAVFAGIVVGSAEALLELLVAGLIGLVIGGFLPPTPYAPVRTYLAVVVPLFMGWYVLPLLLKRNPGGMIEAGLLAVFWAVLGQQQWAAPAFRPWPFAVLAIVGGLVLVRVWFGRWPAPQRSKFGILFSLFFMGAGVILSL